MDSTPPREGGLPAGGEMTARPMPHPHPASGIAAAGAEEWGIALESRGERLA
ncbi:MAG: hypothetical protein U0974_06365 [Gemmatimonadales bacterium]|nr:hypothetical protein [Gemmatimonadales bacterium]MDZ4389336.1 hypothetical protein [Gemmatimonadales bacterium]